MRKVYVALIDHDWGHWDVIGVFKRKEDAEKACREDLNYKTDWEVQEEKIQ